MYFCLEGLVQVGYFFKSKVSNRNSGGLISNEFRGVKKFAQ